jgi:probable F420-dependent oxidoreductase
MSVVRPFRFGGGLFSAPSPAAFTDGARRLESDGYDTMFTGDHYSPNLLAPIPALLSAALATTTLRVACTVFVNDFRHPAALAKEIASVDLLTGGRVEFGIGAGWNKASYDFAGVPFESPNLRVARLEEGLCIVKGLWAESPLTFNGKYYTITNYDGQPKPTQQPHPPIFMGGGGKRLLSFAAREADIVAIGPRAKAVGDGLDQSQETDASVTEKLAWVREAAGERFEHLELARLFWAVAVDDDRLAAAERIAAQRSRTPEQVLASPFFLIGSVEAIVDQLLELREKHGVSYVSVFPRDTEAFAPVVARLVGK